MKISNKPNLRGMEKVANDVTYRTAIMGRDLKIIYGSYNHSYIWN